MATKLRDLVVSLTADSSRFESEINRAKRMGGDYFRSLETGSRTAAAGFSGTTAAVTAQGRAVDTVTTSVKAYGAALAGAFTVTKLVQMTDQWTNMSNRLRQITNNSQELRAAQQAIYDIAQRSRAGLDETADLYFKINQNAKEYGITAAQAARVTETVAKTISMSGAPTASRQAAILQLGQAIGSGRLQGDEYRSLSENAPAILDLIAKQMGVARGALKELASEGKITTQIILQAMQEMGRSVDQQFAKTNASITDAWGKAQNAVLQYIGTSNDAVGASAAVARTLEMIADHFDEIAGVATVVTGGLLIRWLGNLTAGATSAAAATVKQTASTIANAAAQAELLAVAARKAEIDAVSALNAREQLLLNDKLAAGAVRTARARIQEATSTKALAAAERELAQAQRAKQATERAIYGQSGTVVAARETANMARAAEQEARKAATAGGMALTGLRAAGSGVLALFGGPWGVAITAAIAGYMYLTSRQDETRKSLADLNVTLDDYIKLLQSKTKVELESEAGAVRRDIADRRGSLSSAFEDLGNGRAESIRNQYRAIAQDTSLSADQMSEAFRKLTDHLVESGQMGEKYRQRWIDASATQVEHRRELEKVLEREKAVKAAIDGVTQANASSSRAWVESQQKLLGMNAEYKKLIDNLTKARDEAGLSVGQVARKQAEDTGAGGVAASIAENLAEQKKALDEQRKAVDDGDQAAYDKATQQLAKLKEVETALRVDLAGAYRAVADAAVESSRRQLEATAKQGGALGELARTMLALNQGIAGATASYAAGLRSTSGSFSDLISSGESRIAGADPYGVYNRPAGGGYKAGAGLDYDNLSIQQLQKLQADRSVFAFGRYQITPNTLDGLVARLGLDKSQPMDAALQDKLGQALTDARAGGYIRGLNDDLAGAKLGLAKEFASMGVAPGVVGHKGNVLQENQSYYAGIGGNKASISHVAVENSLQDMRAIYAEAIKLGASSEEAFAKAFSSSRAEAQREGELKVNIAKKVAEEQKNLDQTRRDSAAANASLAAKVDIEAAESRFKAVELQNARGLASDTALAQARVKLAQETAQINARAKQVEIDAVEQAMEAKRKELAAEVNPEKKLKLQGEIEKQQVNLNKLQVEQNDLLKAGQEAEQARTLELAKQTTERAKQLALEQTYLDAIRRRNARELEKLGMSDREGQNLDALSEIDEKYNDLINNLDVQGLGAAEYDKALARLQARHAAELELEKSHQKDLEEARQSGALGAQKALSDYVDMATDTYGQAGRMVSGILSTGEDVIVKLATTGKASAAELANVVIEQMARIVAQKAVAGIATGFEGLLGGLFGGGLGSAMTVGGAGGQAIYGGAFGFGAMRLAGGGPVFGPGTTTSDSIPAWLSNGEHIVNAQAANQPGVRPFLDALNSGMSFMRMANGGAVGNGNGGGGAFGNVEVNVHNAPAGTTASVTRDGFGNLDIDIMVKEVEGRLADKAINKQGPLYRAQRSTFHLPAKAAV